MKIPSSSHSPAAAPDPILDAEELLHLSILDSQAGQHDAAIAKLKRAVELDARNARAQYLLAVEYAEISLYDRAIEGLQRAVQLDPTLDTAHFQLGLLHFTRGAPDRAQQAWAALDALGAEHPLFLFKSGLLSLQQGDLQRAAGHLERALQREQVNEPLRRDIEKVLKNVHSRLPAGGAAGRAEPADRASMIATRYGEADPDDPKR